MLVSPSAYARVVGSLRQQSLATFDPLAQNASITLSNNLLLATNSGGSGTDRIALTTQFGNVPLKWYTEFDVTLSAATDMGLGGANPSCSTADGQFLGGTTNSFVLFGAGGVWDSGSNHGSVGPAFTTGDRLRIAWDGTLRFVWFSVNGGVWNKSATNDPATNVGGIDVSSTTGVLSPAVNIKTNNEAATFVPSLRNWRYPAPSGFSAVI